MKKHLFIIPLLFIGCLTACTTGNNDPHSGGFIGGLNGIYSGEYDRRIEERNAEASRQQAITRELQAQFEKRENEYHLKISQLNSQTQRKEEIEKSIAAISEDINRLNSKSVEQRKKIFALEKEISQLQIELDKFKANDTKQPDSSEQYLILEKKRDRLADEYKALMEYNNSLSDTIN